MPLSSGEHKTLTLEKLRASKKKLLTVFLDGKVPEDDYTPANADFSRQIADLERQLVELSNINASTESFVAFAELHLANLHDLWLGADDDQRRRVQTILFRDGLEYVPKTKSLNYAKSTFFNVLEKINQENLWLASPTGFEPVLSP
jgi:hypothetical protein